MKKLVSSIAIFVSVIASNLQVKAQLIHHNLDSKVSVAAKTVEVTDTITLPETLKSRGSFTFYLNPEFSPVCQSKSYAISVLPKKGQSDNFPKSYLLQIKNKNTVEPLVITYKGKVEDEIKTEAKDIVKGFSDTRGIISDKGVYLSGGTYWVPAFDNSLFTFKLTVHLDNDFGVISQGTRSINKRGLIQYYCQTPCDEVYLVAGKWVEYNKTSSNNVLIQAELISNDSALATKYIQATDEYLKMYEDLIGKYPYSKFSLVENFWETGFGMPSFTLLGEKVIRLPFILTSSYPHELLHNYWGNSVYVASTGGNWCEGLTSYLADHHLKEQMGQGAEYRRSILQKYTDYVNASNDFPVSKFTSRHNPAEEAVGYGKVAMIFEMLRNEVGEENFKAALARFYKDNIFKYASFTDIKKSFEATSGKDLNFFFEQWINRPGAPTLKLKDVKLKEQNGFTLSFTLSQEQAGQAFKMKVPVVISVEGSDSSIVKMVDISKASENINLTFNKKPLKIEVDPYYNVFRVLDPNEIPVSISKIQGEKQSVIILPKNSNFLNAYLDLSKEWQENQKLQGNTVEIFYDNDLTQLPNKATWIVGYENKFAPDSTYTEFLSSFMPNDIFSKLSSYKGNGSVVYAFSKQNQARGFLASSNEKAIPQLKRKIMHYGKFGYLAFDGEKAENKLKGEFPATNSPLQVIFSKTAGATKNNLRNRAALR
jgi:hypothetical protein